MVQTFAEALMSASRKNPSQPAPSPTALPWSARVDKIELRGRLTCRTHFREGHDDD